MTSNITFAWWNARLSPPVGKPLNATDRLVVLDELVALLGSGVDLLGMCECAADDIRWLKSALVGTTFDVSSFSVTGAAFRIAAIWNTANVDILDSEYLTDIVRGTSFRVGLRLTLRFAAGLNCDLFLAHWPSRLFHHKESGSREGFGAALRRELDGRKRAGAENFIVVGDFNDEPFDLSLTEGLRSTREPAVVTKKPDLLYNPFWRHIVGKTGDSPQEGLPEGSYYHRSDKLSKWKMLDQMFFSQAFMGSGDWTLDESKTGVHRPPRLDKAVRGTTSKIDHLPVFAQLRRKV